MAKNIELYVWPQVFPAGNVVLFGARSVFPYPGCQSPPRMIVSFWRGFGGIPIKSPESKGKPHQCQNTENCVIYIGPVFSKAMHFAICLPYFSWRRLMGRSRSVRPHVAFLFFASLSQLMANWWFGSPL